MSNVLARPLGEPEVAELYAVSTQGLRKLYPGGGAR